MAGNVVGGQPLQLGHGGFDGLRALLNVAAEFERELRGLVVKRLQKLTSFLVLVHASQPVGEQRALDIVFCGRAGLANRARLVGARPVEIDGPQSLVDGPVQAQSAGGHRHSLRFLLGLVANGFIGGHGVQHRGLRASQAELLDGRIVEPQRVFRRTRDLNGQQRRQCRLVRLQTGSHPGGKRLGGSGSARLPGVKFLVCGNGG